MGELLEAIAAPANLAKAWAAVRANAGAAGVDGQSVTAFAADAERQLVSLQRGFCLQSGMCRRRCAAG